MKICLDPGHFGSEYNPGVAAGYVESNFTWDYYLLMKKLLEEKYGVEVIGTRSSKEMDMPLQTRGKCSGGCDLFISIHSNATVDEHINSVFCHWSVRSGGEGIARAIGEALTEFFTKEWGRCDKPCLYSQESEKHPGYDYFGVLKGAASVGTPAIIVEHSFHTNPQYCKWAMGIGNIARMAELEVDTIAKYYNLTPITTDGHYYIKLKKNLKKGDRGEDVKLLQMKLRQISYTYDQKIEQTCFKNGVPDGSFGKATQEVIKDFQCNAGLSQTGELDTPTREALNEELGVVLGRCVKAQNELQESNEKVKFAKQALE